MPPIIGSSSQLLSYVQITGQLLLQCFSGKKQSAFPRSFAQILSGRQIKQDHWGHQLVGLVFLDQPLRHQSSLLIALDKVRLHIFCLRAPAAAAWESMQQVVKEEAATKAGADMERT